MTKRTDINCDVDHISWQALDSFAEEYPEVSMTWRQWNCLNSRIHDAMVMGAEVLNAKSDEKNNA